MFKQYLENIIYGKRMFVCYVGKFNPFHNAHKAVYDYIVALPEINKSDVYICTEVGNPEQIASYGIPKENIKFVTGYNIQNLQAKLGIKENDVLITVFSDKDLEDGSKSYLTKPPKDNVMSWNVIKNSGDIKYLRPISYIQKKYKGEQAEAKQKKGNGHIVIVPTIKVYDNPISSSRIRALAANNQWHDLKYLVNDYTIKYLQKQ